MPKIKIQRARRLDIGCGQQQGVVAYMQGAQQAYTAQRVQLLDNMITGNWPKRSLWRRIKDRLGLD
jgi:hypothetical protein